MYGEKLHAKKLNAWDSNKFLEKLDAMCGQRTGHIERHPN